MPSVSFSWLVNETGAEEQLEDQNQCWVSEDVDALWFETKKT